MSEITQVDLISIQETMPKKKGRGRPKGSTGSKKTKVSEVPLDIDAEEREMKELREKLMQYSDRNPDIVMKPVNDKISRLVNDMSIDELRARCRQGKKICSGRMDSVVGQQLIYISNQACGALLDCVEELQESTENDQLLHEVTTEYFSLHLLDHIPDELKITGIYASHLCKAYYEAQSKNPVKPKKPTVEIIQESVQEPIAPVQEPVQETPEPETREPFKLSKKDTQVSIPAVQEVRDKLIVMREQLGNLTNH